MPIITSVSVQEKKKNRCNLFIDGEFRTGLLVEIAVKFGLKKGKELSEKDISDIILENEKKEALEKATDYASRGLKTKKQVKDNLLKKGYSVSVAYYCVDTLKDYGIIDDVNYAKSYIESVGKKEGKKLIFYKLMQKGIKKEDIEKAFSESEYHGDDGALITLEKYLKNKEKNLETKAKSYRYLSGRGYGYEEILNAISKFFGEE